MLNTTSKIFCAAAVILPPLCYFLGFERGAASGNLHPRDGAMNRSILRSDDGWANKSEKEGRTVAESQQRFPLTASRAKDWLFRDTQTSWRFSPADDMRIARMFSQLNEEESLEATKAAISIIEDYDNGDPETRKVFAGGRTAKRMLMSAFSRLSELNPSKALEFLEQNDVPQKGMMMQIAYSNLAIADQNAAVNALSKLKGGDLAVALSGVAGTLAGLNPTGALALIEQYPSVDSETKKQVIEMAVAADPQGSASRALQSIGNGKPEILKEVMDAWFDTDKDEALKWAENYTGIGEQAIKAALATEFNKTNPSEAAAQYSKLDDTGDYAPLAASISSNLSSNNLEEAKSWIKGLPEGPAKAAAVEGMVDVWVKKDPYATSQYLSSLPDGEGRNRAIAKFVTAGNKKFPREAYDWACTLPSGEVKEKAMLDLISGWREVDPEAAEDAFRKYQASEKRPSE
jgi:hypothetical protein